MVHSPEEAVREFNVELVKHLPLENQTFFAMVNQAKLFPLNTGNDIQATPTRAGKVAYFIQHILTPGAKEHLPILLDVMKRSGTPDVVTLADNIQSYMRSGLSIVIL